MSIFGSQGASAVGANYGQPGYQGGAYYTGPGASASTSTLRMRSGSLYSTPAAKSSTSNYMGFLYGASTLLTGIQSITQAMAQKTMSQIQKQSYEINKKFAEMQATDAIKRGDREATLHAKKIKKLIGTQRANLAAQGIEVNADSALDIQMESAEFGAIDVETIRSNAFREAWGYKVQALDLGTKGISVELSGESQARNTLLTGGLNTLNLGLDFYRRKSIEDYLK